MKNISKEFKVGLLVVVAGMLLYLGFNFLKGRDFFSSDNTFYTFYDDIDGLTLSNQVIVNGYAVGRVDGIEMLPNQENKLMITLKIKKDISVKEGSVPMLADGGLLGGKQINLVLGKGKLLESGDTLKGDIELGLTDMIAEKAAPLAKNIDSTALVLKNMLVQYEAMSGSVAEILDNTKMTTASINGILADNRQQLKNITANLAALTSSLKDTEAQFKPVIAKLNTFAESLNELEFAEISKKSNELLAELNKTTQSINNADGTLGKLIHSDSLYQQLNYTVSDLDRLLIDLREHPQRYVHLSVFGKKDKKKEEEEKKEK
ncbi:ABC-type transport system involved in resistance to organic solvents, periplasmic component [Bernardetia litoralis DSM 6794]|uniref:ABC-type transport system involved in resistance to organic solvents, periplasmic component n=1 Tax=Bernardetia litoralis (strain ATCC 23117 / DSM 6794 / NBRC 15988 / NCIMB 1366 / Fx l1 / Sio-4) TaxID=880071 RepID=I4AGD9_BERLS|nr:MlaD family protein [Bernardetia litoralis]AFM03024.1 ABC-type transport system involved in resistance to organic solvents, periplasmic component [Bernardetia litoralis DSM 6794]